MWYVGMDVHARQTTSCVLDENGRKIKTRTVRSGWRTVVAELKRLGHPFAVCYEASTGYGMIFDSLAKVAERVEVAHPGHLRLIFRSKRKNNAFDAEKLSKILYLNVVPKVHVPSAEVRSWRATIKYRHRMVDERTRAKNAIRALLRGLAIDAPKGLWTKRGLAWLEGLAFDQEGDALRRDLLLECVRHQDTLIKRVEKWLNKAAQENLAVRLLMTIPGQERYERSAEPDYRAWGCGPPRPSSPGSTSRSVSGGTARVEPCVPRTTCGTPSLSMRSRCRGGGRQASEGSRSLLADATSASCPARTSRPGATAWATSRRIA